MTERTVDERAGNSGARREEVEGVVAEALPNSLFRVRLPDGNSVLAHVPASERLRFVKTLPGDRVVVELSEFDHTRGRIVRRLK